jgi:hypothetical protein
MWHNFHLLSFISIVLIFNYVNVWFFSFIFFQKEAC